VVFHLDPGLLLACAFGIINALWLEHTENLDRQIDEDK
jgi:cyd operon protein YbgT